MDRPKESGAALSSESAAIERGIDEFVLDKIPVSCLVLSVASFAYALIDWRLLPQPASRAASAITAAMAVVYLAIWRFSVSGKIGARHAHPVMALLGSLAMGNVFTTMAWLHDGQLSVNLLLVLFGCSVFFGSRFWLGLIGAMMVAGWCVFLWMQNGAVSMHYTFALGAGLLFAAVLHEFTRRTLVSLQKFKLESQDHVAGMRRMVGALEASNAQAERAARAKDEFLATMSHEIRTPMNAVLGLSGMVLETELTDEQREMVEIAHNSGEALLTIINDILDFSKIESGKLELEQRPLDLRQCVEEVLGLLASQAAQKGIDLAYILADTVPDAIVGDVTRIRQILFNLVGNALKFTQSGEIVVSVSGEARAAPQSGNEPGNESGNGSGNRPRREIHFSVRDTGMGIPPDKLDRLFKPFSQADASTTRKYGGTGLGLAISKRLSELMGGRAWVESQGVPGMGSTFHFTILAEALEAPHHGGPHGPLPELAGKRLLAIEDNETNRRIFMAHAEAWGMTASGVATGAEALALLRQGASFDAAIVDMQLPGADGIALAREIRQVQPKALPLIALTWMGGRGLGEDARLFAAQLTKPIKASQLYNALIAVISHQPVRAGARARKSAPDPKLAARLPLAILLADDNVINQRVAQHTLGRLGYRAGVVANGVEVLEALSRQAYDVVLMDLHMPEMDGVEATRLIRKRFPPARQPRIVAVTADAMQGDRERCLAAGMDDYVSKPLRLEELVRALEQCRCGPEKGRSAKEDPAPTNFMPAYKELG